MKQKTLLHWLPVMSQCGNNGSKKASMEIDPGSSAGANTTPWISSMEVPKKMETPYLFRPQRSEQGHGPVSSQVSSTPVWHYQALTTQKDEGSYHKYPNLSGEVTLQCSDAS